LRGYSILYLWIFPIHYIPQKGEIKYCTQINLTIKCREEEIDSLYRDLPLDQELVKSLVINPTIIHSYPSVEFLKDNTFEYIIITNSKYKNIFNKLALYKSDYISTRIITLDTIYKNHTGRDNQEKIRNFIKYAYLEWNTTYFLLGGDNEIIPHRGLWGDCRNYGGTRYNTTDIPSDYYYAALDGSWDNDNDNIFGEDIHYGKNGEEADFEPEIYIGRAPVNSTTEAEIFVNKVIRYETSVKPAGKSIQLHHSYVSKVDLDPNIAENVPENCYGWIKSPYLACKLYECRNHKLLKKFGRMYLNHQK